MIAAARHLASGARIVTASSDATVRIWDAATGAETACHKTHEKLLHAAMFSPDGMRIVVVGVEPDIDLEEVGIEEFPAGMGVGEDAWSYYSDEYYTVSPDGEISSVG